MDPFLAHVSKSLGRDAIPTSVPPPPAIDERVARLVAPGDDLSLRFTANAAAAKLHVHPSQFDALAADVVAYCREANHKTAVVTRCERFESAGLIDALRAAGVTANYWDETTLDASYEVDVGITDVWAAVAETGSLVVKSSAAHGRATSLVPPYHVCVVGREQIVPDLIDAMRRVKAEGVGTGVVFITGPSKTSDIEMNLVVGVHGPGAVEVFLV
jgi:L-lactate dehydrogenase complex protein LldG